MLVDAVDQRTSQPVTIKVIRPSVAASAAFRREFTRRIAVARSLVHPNVAAVIGAGEMELNGQPTLFWAVDYLGGGSLRDMFDRGRLLQPSQALVVGLEACRALDAAHQRGVIHTEITPSKLVFGEDRRLRVVDFGLAGLLGATAWADPPTVPTHVARYASPEQALGEEIDPKTDVYSLSLCLIEAVTGSVPFAADSTVSTLSARVGKLMPVSADLGPLASVLERAGRPEPEDRFTAAEFARALAGAARKLPRPEPIPVLAASAFAASQMRRPSDPTGPLQRPPGAVDEDEEGDAADPDEAVGVVETADPEEPAEDVGTVEPDGPDAGVSVAEPSEPADLREPDEGVGAVETAGPDDNAEGVGVVEPAAPVEPDPGEAVPDDPAAPDDEDQHGGRAAAVAVAAGLAAATGVRSADADGRPSEVPAVDDLAGDLAEDDVEGDHGADLDEGREREPVESSTAQAPEPLIVLTDVAGPPSGAVEVGETPTTLGDGDRPARPGTTTDVMPATLAPDATRQMGATAARSPAQPYDDEQPTRRLGPIILIALVVLVGLGAVTYAGYLLFRTKSYEVPDLVGVEESVARNEVSGNGWEIIREHERSDDQPEIGDIIRTEPVAGIMLDEGESIVFVVSDGPELRTLPDLDGEPVQDALDELYDLALESDLREAEFSEDVPSGLVISWTVQENPALVAGAQVLPGTVIEVVPSKGPEPREVPNLSGLDMAQVTAELDALRLETVQDDDVFSDDVPVGFVVQQQPAPGTMVERGSTVTVQVSKGPDVVPLPDLTGLPYAEAEALLLDTGFTIGEVLGTTQGSFVSLTIDGASAAPGELFRRGTAVDMIFL